MKTSKFTEEQITMARRQAEAGTAVPELRELRQLRDENRKLKELVADLSLDKTILQEALRRKC